MSIAHLSAEALARSTVKIQAHDVIGTWKVLIGLCLAPLLYATYALIAALIANKAGADWKGIITSAFAVLVALPFVNFSALKFGEAGTDVLKCVQFELMGTISYSHTGRCDH